MRYFGLIFSKPPYVITSNIVCLSIDPADRQVRPVLGVGMVIGWLVRFQLSTKCPDQTVFLFSVDIVSFFMRWLMFISVMK